jgi:hypothetical protein
MNLIEIIALMGSASSLISRKYAIDAAEAVNDTAAKDL